MAGSSIIITGASRGAGRAIALILARMGAAVTLNARTAPALAAVMAEIRDAGGRAAMLSGDISDAAIARQVVATAIDAFGDVDALINNAAVLEPVARIAEGDAQAWQRNFQINVLGPYLLTQAALPHLRRSPHGRVINVSSGAAVRATPGWSAYCVSKAGINMFTAVLAEEEPEITALAVRPGVVDTDMQRTLREQGAEVMPPEQYQHFVRLHRQGKLLPPELPGRALAALALYAPRAWSGRFISWDDAEVRALVAEVFG